MIKLKTFDKSTNRLNLYINKSYVKIHSPKDRYCDIRMKL